MTILEHPLRTSDEAVGWLTTWLIHVNVVAYLSSSGHESLCVGCIFHFQQLLVSKLLRLFESSLLVQMIW